MSILSLKPCCSSQDLGFLAKSQQRISAGWIKKVFRGGESVVKSSFIINKDAKEDL